MTKRNRNDQTSSETGWAEIYSQGGASCVHPDDAKRWAELRAQSTVSIEGEEYAPSITSTIDWRKVRDGLVPPVVEDDPALALIRDQLRWLEARHTLVGNDPTTGRPLAELHEEFKRHLRDEIERYRWRKAGYEPTQEMLDVCRSEEDE